MKIKVFGKPVKLRINGILAKLPNIKIPIPRIEWETTTLPTSAIYEWDRVTYSGDRFLAFSQVNKETPQKLVLYSLDGISWNHLQLPNSSDRIVWSNFAYGNSKFVICAYGYVSNVGDYVEIMYDNRIAYSSDGTSWQISTLPFNGNSQYVVYGNGKFLVNDAIYNYIAQTEDGINWSKIESPFTESYTILFFGNGKFIELGGNNAASSYDGIAWQKTTLPFSAYWESCAYGNGKFLAFGRDSNNITRVIESSDGITWVDVNNNLEAIVSSVAYGNKRFLAATYERGKTWESEDGSEWNLSIMPPELDGPGSQYVSVAYGNNRFVALPYSGNKFAYTNGQDGDKSNSKIGTAKIGTAKVVSG